MFRATLTFSLMQLFSANAKLENNFYLQELDGADNMLLAESKHLLNMQSASKRWLQTSIRNLQVVENIIITINSSSI